MANTTSLTPAAFNASICRSHSCPTSWWLKQHLYPTPTEKEVKPHPFKQNWGGGSRSSVRTQEWGFKSFDKSFASHLLQDEKASKHSVCQISTKDSPGSLSSDLKFTDFYGQQSASWARYSCTPYTVWFQLCESHLALWPAPPLLYSLERVQHSFFVREAFLGFGRCSIFAWPPDPCVKLHRKQLGSQRSSFSFWDFLIQDPVVGGKKQQEAMRNQCLTTHTHLVQNHRLVGKVHQRLRHTQSQRPESSPKSPHQYQRLHVGKQRCFHKHHNKLVVLLLLLPPASCLLLLVLCFCAQDLQHQIWRSKEEEYPPTHHPKQNPGKKKTGKGGKKNTSSTNREPVKPNNQKWENPEDLGVKKLE